MDEYYYREDDHQKERRGCRRGCVIGILSAGLVILLVVLVVMIFSISTGIGGIYYCFIKCNYATYIIPYNTPLHPTPAQTHFPTFCSQSHISP